MQQTLAGDMLLALGRKIEDTMSRAAIEQMLYLLGRAFEPGQIDDRALVTNLNLASNDPFILSLSSVTEQSMPEADW